LGLGLTETPEALNTITVGNSLSFPMVHKMAPNNRRFMSYGCRKLDLFAESEFLVRPYFRHKSPIWQNFTMTSLETLNTKITVNELIFLLVSHTVDADARLDSYGILKLGQGAENFPGRLDI
jgi:hypothetical protein